MYKVCMCICWRMLTYILFHNIVTCTYIDGFQDSSGTNPPTQWIKYSYYCTQCTMMHRETSEEEVKNQQCETLCCTSSVHPFLLLFLDFDIMLVLLLSFSIFNPHLQTFGKEHNTQHLSSMSNNDEMRFACLLSL